MSRIETFLPESAAPFRPNTRVRMKIPAGAGVVDLSAARIEGELEILTRTYASGGTAGKWRLEYGIPSTIRSVILRDGHGAVVEELHNCNVYRAMLSAYTRSIASGGVDARLLLQESISQSKSRLRFSFGLADLGLGCASIKEFPCASSGGLQLELLFDESSTAWVQPRVNMAYPCDDPGEATPDTFQITSTDHYPQPQHAEDPVAGPLRPGEFVRVAFTRGGDEWIQSTTVLSVDYTKKRPEIITADSLTKGTGTIATFGTIVGGAGYANNTYNNRALTGGSGFGATANITVTGGSVTAVTLVSGGFGYQAGESLSAAQADIGGTGAGFSVPIATLAAPGNVTDITIIAEDGRVVRPASPQAPSAGANVTTLTFSQGVALKYLYVGMAVQVLGTDDATKKLKKVSTYISAMAPPAGGNVVVTLNDPVVMSANGVNLVEPMLRELPATGITWHVSEMQMSLPTAPGKSSKLSQDIITVENLRERIPAGVIAGELHMQTGARWERSLAVLGVPIDTTTVPSVDRTAYVALQGCKDHIDEYQFVIDGMSAPLSPVGCARVDPVEHWRYLAQALKQVSPGLEKISQQCFVLPKAFSKYDMAANLDGKRVSMRWRRSSTVDNSDLAVNMFHVYKKAISY